jgi:signal transduction histidine kinase
VSLKARITFLTVAVTASVVFALVLLQLNNVIESWVGSSIEIAEIAGRQVTHVLIVRVEERQAADRARGGDQNWSELLKQDPGAASLLETTMAQTRSILEISVAEAAGTVIASSNPLRPGSRLVAYPELSGLQRLNPFKRAMRVLRGGSNYELRIPIGVSGRPVFTVQVVVSQVLLRDQMLPAIRRVAEWAAAALIASIVVSWLSARLVARNLSRISVAIDRIATGDAAEKPEPVNQALPEFAAIESKLNVLGHQFRGAAELRGAVERILGGLAEAIVLFDHDGRVTLAGGAVDRVLGVAAAEIRGRPVGDIFALDSTLGRVVAESFSQRQPLQDHAVEWRRNGSAAPLLINVEFSADPHQPDRFTGLLRIRDAGGRRQLESHLGASVRMDAMSRITGSVAHEIKNPLNSIAVRLDNLQAWATGDFPEAEKELQLISDEVNRLDRVVRTFLDFTRPVELSTEEVDAVGLVRQIATLLEADAARRGVQLRFQAPGRAIAVLADADLLSEAIINIVTNGIEAMPGGGLLDVEVREDAGHCFIAICDTGAGIPESVREKIFELYFTTKKNGSGLGLPMAFRAVQLHGGSIDVQSEPGRGTRFELNLPMIGVVESRTF